MATKTTSATMSRKEMAAEATERAATGGGEPLVILAAGGDVPLQVATAARDAGRDVLIIGLEGEAAEGIKAFPHAMAKWGQIGRVEELIRSHGAREVVVIGTVARRPDFSTIAVDFGTLRYLPRLIKGMVGGDDSVLANFAAFAEQRGYRIVGAHEVAPALVAKAGAIVGRAPHGATLADARLAMDAARGIGAMDIGQAAVAVNARVVALEAAEGTDAMLERVAVLRANGRARWSGRAGVLAKRSKPQQDLRLDMPAIGPRTVEGVAAAGLAGIVIEAGRVMIAERAAAVTLAERTGTFIFAVDGEASAA
jgi:DUF1009 family protein